MLNACESNLNRRAMTANEVALVWCERMPLASMGKLVDTKEYKDKIEAGYCGSGWYFNHVLK